MKQPAFLGRLPKAAFIGVVPVAAFLVAAAISMATSSDNGTSNTNAVAESTPTSVVQAVAATPTATTVPQPTATSVPDRTDCTEIRGTTYRSDAERTWYQENCNQPVTTNVASAPVVRSNTTTTTTTTTQPTSAAQVPIGDRLIINKIGVNADVYGTVVGPSGAMADPVGYFNVVWYDFQNHPGLGGYNSGNRVIAGHVDSAVYGAVVFYNVASLVPGDTIQYQTASGELYTYVVTSMGDFTPGDNWNAIVGSGTADLTLITCSGTFDTSIRQYTHRRVVFAQRF